MYELLKMKERFKGVVCFVDVVELTPENPESVSVIFQIESV